MTTPHPTAPIRHAIPDDAPATAFAPTPICPYRAGSAEAVEYAAGHVAAAKTIQTKGQ